MGKHPVCSACPRCGSTGFSPVAPRTVFAFGPDRLCAECSTLYSPPTSRWGSLSIVIVGLAMLAEPAYLICADPRLSAHWLVAIWGTLSYTFGVCCVIRGMDLLFERRQRAPGAAVGETTEAAHASALQEKGAEQAASERTAAEQPIAADAVAEPQAAQATSEIVSKIAMEATVDSGTAAELLASPEAGVIAPPADPVAVEDAALIQDAALFKEAALGEATAMGDVAPVEDAAPIEEVAPIQDAAIVHCESSTQPLFADQPIGQPDSAQADPPPQRLEVEIPAPALAAPVSPPLSPPAPIAPEYGLSGLEFQADQLARAGDDLAAAEESAGCAVLAGPEVFAPPLGRPVFREISSSRPSVAAMTVAVDPPAGAPRPAGPPEPSPVPVEPLGTRSELDAASSEVPSEVDAVAEQGGPDAPSPAGPGSVDGPRAPVYTSRMSSAPAIQPPVVPARKWVRSDHNLTGIDYRAPMPWPKVRGSVIDFHCHLLAARHARVWFETAWHYGIDIFFTMTQLEEVMGLQRDWPGRLHFIAVPQWYYEGGDFISDWLRRIEAFYNLGSRIVKFHMAPQTIVRRGWRLDSPRLEPIFREIEARGMMIMSHVGDPDLWYAGRYADAAKYGTREEHYRMWETVLERCRRIPWIGAHLGGNPEDLNRLQSLLDRYPNLSLDCSATRWMAREVSARRDEAREFFIRNAGRILFGSDQVSGDDRGFDFLASRWWTHRKLWETAFIGPCPIVDPDLPDHSGPELRGLALPDDVLQKMYHDNAVALVQKAGVQIEEIGRTTSELAA